MGDRALAAEMPKDFQGTWCTSSNTLKDDWSAYNTEGADCQDSSSVEIIATGVKSSALSVSCVVRQSPDSMSAPGDDLSKTGAGAGSKAVSVNPVGSRLSTPLPIHERF